MNNFSLAADIVLFNSNYNRNSFLNNIAKIIKIFPDYRPKDLEVEIKNKSQVLYFPIAYPEGLNNDFCSKTEILHIVWPHRWEFDKAPNDLFNVLYKLKKDNFKFVVSILGECFHEVPTVFEEAKTILNKSLINFGFVESKLEFYKILKSAHIVVSTALHEFFGVAM